VLTDPVEIEIVSRARQKNVRDPQRSRQHFTNIFSDFLSDLPMRGMRLLDLGPGQFDFGVLARDRGAEVVSIDNDPAVVELGNYKGFRCFEGSIQDIAQLDLGGSFDGVFCKFSINAFWYWDDENGHVALAEAIGRFLKSDGWSWIAPWNGAPKKAELSARKRQDVLSVQADLFRALGFIGFDLNGDMARRYGVTGAVENHALFLRGLRVPDALKSCASL